MDEQIVTLDLGEGMKIAVRAESHGPHLVADTDIVAKLSAVTKPVEHVSREILEAIKKGIAEQGLSRAFFGLAIEQGNLIALFGKGKGEATIKVTLEWSNPAEVK